MTGRGGYEELHRDGPGCPGAVVTLGWRLNRAGKRGGGWRVAQWTKWGGLSGPKRVLHGIASAGCRDCFLQKGSRQWMSLIRKHYGTRRRRR